MCSVIFRCAPLWRYFPTFTVKAMTATQAKKKTKIITVFNMKGGCSKTMTAMQLAGSLGLLGYQVLVSDMDKQGTGSQWSVQADDANPFPAKVVNMSVQKELMVREIQKFVGEVDFVIIDCPPAIESMIPWAALNISDLGLVPVIPVLDNIWASKAAYELGLRAQEENPSLQLACVISMVRRGRLFDFCQDKLKENQQIPILNATIGMRNAYPESQAYGATVHALGKGSLASQEVDALTKEVLTLLGLKIKAKSK